MNIEDFDKFVKETTLNTINGDPYYGVLGLCGETGEVAEKLKKIRRDKQGVFDDYSKGEVIKELGDVVWYVTNIAGALGSSLEEVIKVNIDKINSRRERGVMNGNGDNR